MADRDGNFWNMLTTSHFQFSVSAQDSAKIASIQNRFLNKKKNI